MHSALLLWSLLAVIPFISANPARRDDDANIVQKVYLSGALMYGFSGCHKLGPGGLRFEATPSQGTASITVETCLETCLVRGDSQGGVADSKCYCDSSTKGGTKVDDSECRKSFCAGNRKEYCGSSDRLILYEKTIKSGRGI